MATESALAPTKPTVELSKREKNRLAARKCRAKKKMEESDLMKKLRDTRSQLSQLRYEVYQLEEKRANLLKGDHRKRVHHSANADATGAAMHPIGAASEDLSSVVRQLLSDDSVATDSCVDDTAAADFAGGRASDDEVELLGMSMSPVVTDSLVVTDETGDGSYDGYDGTAFHVTSVSPLTSDTYDLCLNNDAWICYN